MMLFMMQLKVTWVGRIPLFIGPTAFLAGIFVADKCCSANGVRNFAVMRGTLSIIFKQIRSANLVYLYYVLMLISASPAPFLTTLTRSLESQIAIFYLKC